MAAKRGSTYEVRSVRYQVQPEEPASLDAGGRSAIVVILIDRDQKLISASPGAARLFNTTVEECIGRPLAWFLHPDDRDALTLHDLSSGNRDEGNSPGALSQVEAALEKLTLAIEQTADSVLITDRDGVIEYVNPAFEEMTGFSRQQVIGGTPRILHSGVHTHEFYDRLWGTILSGRTFRAVMTNRRQDGTLYDEDQTITPIRAADGTITHFVSTGRDITHRKRSQEALQRLNQQLERESERIGAILHDEAGQFLTSAHITLADVCHDAAPEVRERLLMVRGHLDRIEQRLREISHEIHPRIVADLGLRDAVTFLAESFSRRTGITVHVESLLHVRYAASVEALVYRFVQEGLTNISRHARAATAVVKLDGNPEVIACSIRDDGVGFNAGTLCGRGSSSLGLHVMRDRLEAAGGTLEILSAPGTGTELRATIPVEA